MKSVRLYLFSILICSCANIGTLGGGPADKSAPVLLSSNISETGFRSKKIILEFDEYIKLNSPDKNISLLPLHTTMKYQISKKKLIIDLDSSLHENTTYQLIINKGITDYNEDNPFEYSTVFSTGAHKDSSVLGLTVVNPESFKNLKLSIGKRIHRDSFKGFETSYVQEAGSSPTVFRGLKKDNYNIWLYTDEDQNRIPDYYKPIAFIRNAASDSFYQIEPQVWRKPFTIEKIVTDGKYHKLFYTGSPDYREQLFSRLTLPADKALWYNEDSALISGPMPQGINRTDTVIQINPLTSLKTEFHKNAVFIRTKSNYILRYKQAQCYRNTGLSDPYKPFILTYASKPDSLVLYNRVTEVNDTFDLKKIPVTDINSYSFLQVNIKADSNEIYDVYFYKDDKPVMVLSGISNYTDYMEPGNYKIQIRKSGSVRSFNPVALQEMFPVIYEKSFYLKASWEEILDIKP